MEMRRSALASRPDGHRSVSTALLVGEGAAIPRLAGTLASTANLPVEIGEPWAGMSLNPTVTHNQPNPAEFAVATGLAMSGFDRRGFINLMLRERVEQESKRRKGVARAAALAFVAAVLLAALISGNPT